MPKLVYLPDLNPNSLLLFTQRGDSFRLREYSDPKSCRQIDPNGKTADEILSSGTIIIPIGGHDVEEAGYWFQTIAKHNLKYGISSAPNQRPEPVILPEWDQQPQLAISAEFATESLEAPHRDRGSYRHMLDLISSPEFESIINTLLQGTGSQLAEQCHPRPSGRSCREAWREMDLEEYLNSYPLPDCPGIDPDWWFPYKTNLNRRPMWDLICQIRQNGRPGLLLIEAKAHLYELSEQDQKSKPNKSSTKSIANDLSIRLRLSEASLGLRDLGLERACLSADSHYQISNRLAYSWKLASQGIPVVLMYLGWINSPDWTVDPLASPADWERIVSSHLQTRGVEEVNGNMKRIGKHGSLQFIIRSWHVDLECNSRLS